MTEGMANSIMYCKYWLGFEEFCLQDLSQLIKVEEEVEVNIAVEDDDKQPFVYSLCYFFCILKFNSVCSCKSHFIRSLTEKLRVKCPYTFVLSQDNKSPGTSQDHCCNVLRYLRTSCKTTRRPGTQASLVPRCLVHRPMYNYTQWQLAICSQQRI